jgi:uncharacterized protein (TIGR02246 family)
MGKRRWFGLMFGLIGTLVLGLMPGPQNLPVQAEDRKDTDHPAPGKGKRAQEFIAAFNRGDAKAVAGFWTEDGDYIDQDGREYKGRAAIQKLYETHFAGHKGGKLSIHVTSARQLTPDVMLEDGITEVAQPDGGPPTTGKFSAVAVKKDGEWYFESVRESIARPPSNAEHFEDLETLIGEWTGETAKGTSGAARYSWAENQNFIVSNFATTMNGIPVVGGTQWIAWDAVDKKVRSFTFYSGGGFGQAVWTKDGNKWTSKVTAHLANGKEGSATNILTIVDPDHITYQVTKLTIDGKTLPDAPPQRLKRVKEAQP